MLTTSYIYKISPQNAKCPRFVHIKNNKDRLELCEQIYNNCLLRCQQWMLASFIGEGSIVNKDIPPNTVAVVNPCRVIKSID